MSPEQKRRFVREGREILAGVDAAIVLARRVGPPPNASAGRWLKIIRAMEGGADELRKALDDMERLS
jgi:hypothetical protein